VSLSDKSRFDAATVVALTMQNDARRLEIKLADAGGSEHVVSLPIPAAVDLAKFVLDACSFMTRLKQRPDPSAGT
jgi:hypothetical protein